jgi:hydroxymethylglutaryl-CoA reductase
MPAGSRIPGFYRISVDERRRELIDRAALSEDDIRILDGGGLDAEIADRMIENVIGIYGMAFGLGLNFRINDRDFLVPMVVEEPSVIAAASNAARLVRTGGGFTADADDAVMTAQIEVLDVGDHEAARARLEEATAELLALAQAALPRLVDRGGGARALEVRTLPGRVILHVHVDCRNAMGANLANTVAEALADRAAHLAGGRRGLRILTNLCDRRCVRVSARVPAAELATDDMDGPAVRNGIVAASRFAEDDPYRAATHNKGIMNGVDAVVIATGNDWRGVEAGAHSFAAVDGRYRPLATWRAEPRDGADADLVGRLEMPMAIGTVGGTLHAHEGARLAQRLLGVTDAKTLAMVVGSAGLASNLAALRALATDGILRGHMPLHYRSHAIARAADGGSRLDRGVEKGARRL